MRLINIFFIIVFGMAILLLMIMQDELLKSNNVIAVKWCYGWNSKQQVMIKHYFGIYLYAEHTDDERVILRAQVYNSLLKSIFDFYSLNYSPVIAVITDKQTVLKEWGVIRCRSDGEVEIGNQGYILKQDFIRMN